MSTSDPSEAIRWLGCESGDMSKGVRLLLVLCGVLDAAGFWRWHLQALKAEHERFALEVELRHITEAERDALIQENRRLRAVLAEVPRPGSSVSTEFRFDDARWTNDRFPPCALPSSDPPPPRWQPERP
jgi:hypothetical protein